MNKTLLKEIDKAKTALLNNEVIAFPTETVMGFGILPNEISLNKLNSIKGERGNKPYTLMCGYKNQIAKFAKINNNANKLIKKLMPGSITLILPFKKGFNKFCDEYFKETIGIRIPSNVEALNLLRKIKTPLLVPSANRSGKTPASNSNEVIKEFNDELGAVISGQSQSQIPSTVINLTKKEPVILREGAISFSQIKKVISNKI